MRQPKQTGSIDLFRACAALLVVAIHTSPLASYSPTADFVFARLIARVAVPFFIMVTGYFLLSGSRRDEPRRVYAFCKKVGLIYGLSILAYLPLNAYAGHFEEIDSGWKLLKMLMFDGTFYHLWYLPAMIVGVALVATLKRYFGMRVAAALSVLLYAIGLLGDSYYGLSAYLPAVRAGYERMFMVFDYSRNGLLYVPIFLVLGSWMANREQRDSLRTNAWGLLVSGGLLVTEGLALHAHSLQRHDSMYVMLVPCMYFLFRLVAQIPGRSSKSLRDWSLLLYLVHPWVIVMVEAIGKRLAKQAPLLNDSLLQYALVCAASMLLSWAVLSAWNRIRPLSPSPEGRSWVEIDLAALVANARTLQGLLPNGSRLMAVVKANAYGHGDVACARALNRAGFDAFAVAALSEAVRLRKHRIKGEILILGYTPPRQAYLLRRYRLTQSLVDYDYARELDAQGVKVKAHVKIDTGMHRLGVDADDEDELEGMFALKHLRIEGAYSHFSVSDSLAKPDIAFTRLQLERFYRTVDKLRSKGHAVGKLHIQASYGILNYPMIACDYARAGIALYGALSHKRDTVRSDVQLRPVLALKARVAAVKLVGPGESIGYGRTYTTEKPIRVATVTIGYADGLPRSLSNAGAYVLVHGKRAPILGRICMDQLTIDVTDIERVREHDIATLIGADGRERIACEDIALKSGTITNEILSGLGSRLAYRYSDRATRSARQHTRARKSRGFDSERSGIDRRTLIARSGLSAEIRRSPRDVPQGHPDTADSPHA